MRVGIFSDTWLPQINGCSTSIPVLKKALEDLGHQVFVVTVNCEKMKYDYDEKNKILRVPGMLLGIYDYRVTSIYPIKSLKIIKEWNLDVIHSQSEYGGLGNFSRIISKQYKIPLVHTYHTMLEDHKIYITKGHFDKLSAKMVEGITKFYCEKTIDQLIVPTKKVHDFLKNWYELDMDIHIISSGIEVGKFRKKSKDLDKIASIREKLGINKRDFVVIYLGRVGPEKNVEFLLNAHFSLIKRHDNLKLLIVGDGPERNKFEKMAIDDKSDDSVIFAGKVDFSEVPYYYALADVNSMASRTETQGLTVIEAMASGTMSICIDDDSFTPFIVEGYDGKIFKDSKEYEKIISELINNRNKVSEMSKQAKVSVEKYSSKASAKKVVKVYEKALNMSRKTKKSISKKQGLKRR